MPPKTGMMITTDLLGRACLELENYERASECFEKVLEFVILEGNKKKEMEALDLLAQACYKSGELEQQNYI